MNPHCESIEKYNEDEKIIKPTIKIINDNNLEISLILYPRKIIEELNNKNKIKGDIVFLWNFFYSIFYGKKAEQNPWKSNTLEWTTPVEHMHGNWPGQIPHVHRWSYDYSKPGHDEDFVPQNIPLKEGEEESHH